MPDRIVPFLFVAVPVILFLFGSVLLTRFRKSRWREAAALMNAGYTGERSLRLGVIDGRIRGRSFRIEERRIRGGRSGRYSVTWITAPLQNTGAALHLPADFFRSGCDPAKALRIIRHTEDMRVFVTNIKVDRIRKDPLSSEERGRLAEALKGWNPAMSPVGNPVGRESVSVQSGHVVFSRSGIITDVRRLKALADMVTELARRIEEHPV